MPKLLTNEAGAVTTDGVEWRGGWATVFAGGTWGGATAYLEISPDNVTWFNEPGLTFTADTMQNYLIASGAYIRARVAGVGVTSLNLWVI
jgi:hypothetical protein